jgi:hypothetical protein
MERSAYDSCCGETAPTRVGENIWCVTKSNPPSVHRVQVHVFCKIHLRRTQRSEEVLPKPTEAVDSTLSLGPAVQDQALDCLMKNKALTLLKELLIDLKGCLHIYLSSQERNQPCQTASLWRQQLRRHCLEANFCRMSCLPAMLRSKLPTQPVCDHDETGVRDLYL